MAELNIQSKIIGTGFPNETMKWISLQTTCPQ